MVTSLERTGHCLRSFLSLSAGPASGSDLDDVFWQECPKSTLFSLLVHLIGKYMASVPIFLMLALISRLRRSLPGFSSESYYFFYYY